MKLIIDIPEDVYEECQGHIYFPDTGGELFNAVKNGTPLDDVKAEIREKSFNYYFEYGEYIGEDYRKERIINSDQVLDILDNIGKAESEDKE